MRTKMGNKTKVKRSEISEALNKDDKIWMKDKKGNFKVKNLYTNLAIPSYVHGYSLAIEYMKNWFLEKFPNNYFKTVYVNGKHVLDDFKQFNKDMVKREKPMLAIMPTVEYDFDREFVDQYAADPSIFLKRSNYQQAFFKDYDREMFLGFNFQALKMNFTYRIRVSTRAQQLDLFKRMELMFRVGATQKAFISSDFHIPKDIMIEIAKKAGFEVDEKNKHIKDVLEFIGYMNRHSDLPVMFKMRAINQKPEFFVKVKDLCTHIACSDRISVDDGEKDGQLDNNFHLEFQCVLTIPIPQFYVLYSAEDLEGSVTLHETNNISVGLYSFNDFEIPEKNELGWYQVALTSYLTDSGETYVDMSEVFSGHTNLDKVMEYNLKNFISPKSFIDIKVYRGDDRAMFVRTEMDYVNKRLNFLEEMEEETVYIAIYADREYINDTIITIDQYYKDRIGKTKL